MSRAAARPLALVGDHFMIGLRPSPQLEARDRALLAELRPAGVVLFKSNFVHDRPYEVWIDVHRKLIADVRDAVGRDRLLIAIDHEGGRVCRTPPPITRFDYAVRWAEHSEAVGRAMGVELASLGINLDFAPVLDIHSNPTNPVIGPRAFGDSADKVSAAALAFMRGLQAQAVLACGKHFPGHGDTATDSHRELPVLHGDLPSLRARELAPFRAAIGAGMRMIMTSHLMFPHLDAAQPVTLSPRFNRDLLRGELGFRGVIVTDDIGMRAVSGLFEDPTAAVRLLLAGADMLLVCAHFADTERCRGCAHALSAAQASGQIPRAEAERSRERVRLLLDAAVEHPVTALPPEVFAQHRRAGALFEAATAEVI